jgi:ketosteroid isomerase-like protein
MNAPDTSVPAELVRAVYDAYARRDVEAVFAGLSAEVVLLQSDALPWGGRYDGLAGARRFLRLLAEHVDSQVEVQQVVPAGDRVVVVGRTRGTVRATGTPFDVPAVHVWSVRHGEVARVETYVDTPAMLAALAA